MKASELLREHYDELTVLARDVIETSDDRSLEMLGDFNNAYEFNMFVAEYY